MKNLINDCILFKSDYTPFRIIGVLLWLCILYLFYNSLKINLIIFNLKCEKLKESRILKYAHDIGVATIYLFLQYNGY